MPAVTQSKANATSGTLIMQVRSCAWPDLGYVGIEQVPQHPEDAWLRLNGPRQC